MTDPVSPARKIAGSFYEADSEECGQLTADIDAALRSQQAAHEEEIAGLRAALEKAEDNYDRELVRAGRFPNCSCNDDDCLACAHYPAVVEQARQRIAARAALTSTKDGASS